MLVLLIMIMERSNVRKNIREPSNVVKVWSHVMLILPNVTIKLLNVRKKKIRMPPNVKKV